MMNYFYNIFPSSATFGDRQYDCYSDDILMYNDNNWIMPSRYNSPSEIIPKRKIHLSHCQNCSAPVNPNSSKCDYCNSYYIEEG